MNPTRIYIIAAASGAGGALIILLLFSFAGGKIANQPSDSGNGQVDSAYSNHIRDNYRIYSLPSPTQLQFAGEEVPLNIPDVRERIDRELLVNTYWHSNTLLTLKRANRWMPLIESILHEEGVPDDFKYLCAIESGFTNAVSPAGATGFWQFLEETGKKYGLEINGEVDERYHVEKSTRAACKYLREAFASYGSWTMAAASYNMGTAGVDRQLLRQEQSEYWHLYLNEETSRYVPRIVALKEIMNHADDYGFVVRPADLYAPYSTKAVSVDTAVTNFSRFAAGFGLDYKTLKIYNPWLRDALLRNKDNKHYVILLPSE